MSVGGKLGKKPHVPDHRDFQSADFITGQAGIALPAVPANFGHGRIFHDGERPFADWDMNGNGPDDTVVPGFDGAGDCVFACAAHTTRAVNKIMGRKVAITGKESISDYSACTGYKIGDPATDNGTEMREAMKYRQKVGILDASGHRHKIGAYLSLPTNWDALIRAAYIFDAVEIGFQFQQAQDAQFNDKLWDYEPGSPIEGGHAVALFGRNQGRAGLVSWGSHVWGTQGFIDHLCDEAWGIVYPDSLNGKGVNDRGLDIAHLNAALQALGH